MLEDTRTNLARAQQEGDAELLRRLEGGLTELNGSLEQSAAESNHRAQVRGVLTRACVMGGAVCSWQRRLLLD